MMRLARLAFAPDASREISVVGLGKSGRAAAEALTLAGYKVYASDAAGNAATEKAAAELRVMGVAVDVGSHDLERIARSAMLVVSPGVPPSAPPLVRAREAGVRQLSEITLGRGFLGRTRVIAITGTNGKTTTTALTGHLLRALGVDAVDAGNIGRHCRQSPAGTPRRSGSP